MENYKNCLFPLVLLMAYEHAEWQIVSTYTKNFLLLSLCETSSLFFCISKKNPNESFFCVASRERKSKSALLTTTAESGRITTVQQEIQELSTPAVEKKLFFSLLHFSFDVKHFVGLSAAFHVFYSATNTLNGTLSTEQEREGNEEGKKKFRQQKY